METLGLLHSVFSSTFPDGISHSEDILGVLSLIIYTLLLIPMFKYVFIVLWANDNGDAHGEGDVDGDDESRPEFLCPFCAKEFDIVGLCCHIDEAHHAEAKNGTNKADGLASRNISETHFTSQIDASSRQQIGRSKSASSRQQIGEAIERYTTDGRSRETLEKGTIHGDAVFSAVDFTTGDEPWPIFKLQKEFNFPGKSPPLSAEFYIGWLTHWGKTIAILYWLAN